ncbi:Opy2 domain-containing protein [Mycena sanguinolenta]|uniref:Opy2 domain-containing protein n=1 Tax=Mycena sanguinolenta TaxID=230812 RepID=A0A8H7CYU0_9AGAR|nr:Opy2 domain-containing protein [Mycena sanguinolenta]
MRLEALLPRASDGCVTCPPTPQCNCGSKQCFLTSRSCTTCATVSCVDTSGNGGSGSSGVSKGALAGAVIGSLIFLALAVCAFLWYRRRLHMRAAAMPEVKPDIPASAETVLNRPDPNAEKAATPPAIAEPIVRLYSSSTIDLDPQSQNTPLHNPSRQSTQSNPFSDNNSIQTAGTEGTNVIPIALVSPEHQSTSDTVPTASTGPVRPSRSPDLNLDHTNVSLDSLRPGNNLVAPSTRSGISAVSSRNSYMSNASFSSDFLNEAPMIITPVKGSVRVVKAEVISTGSLSPVSAEGPRPMSRPPAKSPLATQSFGPADVVQEEDEPPADPFRDSLSPDSASVTTFGHTSSNMRTSLSSDISASLPWTRPGTNSRPTSLDTQAASLIDIGSATRVNVGLATPLTGSSFPRSPFRTTMGRLVTPNTADSLEAQQQRAIDHAQARAHAQGGVDLPARRISNSSVFSAASTRADSILESFPFVPPSPISDRPMRSPSAGQQTFPQNSPRRAEFKTQPPNRESTQSDLPAPPDRRTLGMSTASQFSTASSGLGSFPFQIDSGNSTDSTPPVPFNGRQRASLDTLALTSDLSSYPLGFDRDSVAIPVPQRDSDTLPRRDRKI